MNEADIFFEGLPEDKKEIVRARFASFAAGFPNFRDAWREAVESFRNEILASDPAEAADDRRA